MVAANVKSKEKQHRSHYCERLQNWGILAGR